jgi:CRISPR-associated protein Cmr2
MPLTFRELALLKVRALTHDPPNKSFLVKSLGTGFGREHKEIASRFREAVLKDTPLGGVGLRKEIEEVVGRADRLASSFDRWVLRASDWPRESYVYYNYIHNPFDPKLKSPLSEAGADSLFRVATRINKVLTELRFGDIVDRAPEREVSIYNALYILLEASWYAEGLPPALADTRVPTHTVFDHLYATATAVNMTIPTVGGGDKPPGGFLVVVDYPGVQAFVNSGRKTGDLWAASWLLSNLLWSTASYFGLMYGYDVIVSPTSRLNPYALRSFVAHLLSSTAGAEERHMEYNMVLDFDGTISSYGLKDLGEVLTGDEGLLHTYASVYGLKDYRELLELWLQPIVPATVLMILPPEVPGKGVVESENVVREVVEAYNRSWGAIKDFIFEKLRYRIPLEGATGVSTKVIKKVFEKYSELLEAPPQSPTVAVVDLARVYEALVRCLEGEEELCGKLGIGRSLIEGARALSRELENGVLEVAGFLLWHVALSRWRALSRGPYGLLRSGIPRPFWYIDESGDLKPVHEGLESQPSGWLSCSLCGEEPAVLATKKSPDRLGEVTFSKETIEMLEELSEVKITTPEVVREIEKVVKPGETLGPYCLFKRATYLVFRERLPFISTDDVALSGISRFLSGIGRETTSRLIDAACRRVKWSQCRELVEEYLLLQGSAPHTSFKDLKLAARVSGARYEELRDGMTRALREACYEEVGVSVGVEPFFEEILRLMGLNPKLLSEPLGELVAALRESVRQGHRELVRGLCNFLSLRDVYAIVRGDADYIGEVLSGKRLANPRDLLDVVVRSIEEGGEVVGNREEVFKALREGYERAFRMLEDGGSLLSPSVTHSISLSLMLTAIEDWRTLKERGVLVYSGGDDVYALVAMEESLATALELRRNYYSKGFKILRSAPVVPEIPTGRSFSVRLARLTDVLSEEAAKTFSILEEVSKESAWSTVAGWKVVKRKDALTLSSSISGIQATVPLDPGLGVITSFAEVLPLLLLTTLSSNLPEDFEEFAVRPVIENPQVLEKVALYVLGRNLKVESLGESSMKHVRGYLEELVKSCAGVYVGRHGGLNNVFEELVNLVRVWRVVM